MRGAVQGQPFPVADIVSTPLIQQRSRRKPRRYRIEPEPQLFTADEMVLAVSAAFFGGALFTSFCAWVWAFSL